MANTIDFHPTEELTDLSRKNQFFLLTVRLGNELSIEDLNFQGFLYLLCGVSRVEQAIAATKKILNILSLAQTPVIIETSENDYISSDERTLLALSETDATQGLKLAKRLVPGPLDKSLVSEIQALTNAIS